MNIALDIGNTCLKRFVVFPNGTTSYASWCIPTEKSGLHSFVKATLLSCGVQTSFASAGRLPLNGDACRPSITWWIAQTGNLDGRKLQAAIFEERPKDQFQFLTHQDILIKQNVDAPEKVGIDRLLAAFSAVNLHGGKPMLIVDSGTAITVDLVCDQTFHGGAILPGLSIQSQVYPAISPKLPLVSLYKTPKIQENPAPWANACDFALPAFPGKNSEDAIKNGLYWGTVGAIAHFFDWMQGQWENLRLILTGGDAECLLSGLSVALPPEQIEHRPTLVSEGIIAIAGVGTVGNATNEEV